MKRMCTKCEWCMCIVTALPQVPAEGSQEGLWGDRGETHRVHWQYGELTLSVQRSALMCSV